MLARSGDNDIQAFLSAIQAGQFEGLLEVLSDELIGQIDSILEHERVRTVRSHVLTKLAGRYPTIQKRRSATWRRSSVACWRPPSPIWSGNSQGRWCNCSCSVTKSMRVPA